MKRIISVVLLVVLSLSVMTTLVDAGETNAETQGVEFEKVQYTVNKKLEEIPLSIEACITLPENYTERGGVIFGNYISTPSSDPYKNPCINFEIYYNGVPRVYILTKSAKIDIKFNNVNIAKGVPVHLAIVLDSANSLAHCYINGELVQSKSTTFELTDVVLKNQFRIGGDARTGIQTVSNAQWFKGNISKIALYSDVREANDIQDSINAVDITDDALIWQSRWYWAL